MHYEFRQSERSNDPAPRYPFQVRVSDEDNAEIWRGAADKLLADNDGDEDVENALGILLHDSTRVITLGLGTGRWMFVEVTK